ncbi:ribonuclease 3 [Nephila pilipes]|uniref:Ribonuclease 3 n=1 Tax=Nephila pilipes TaxID=299642 RepID=A0A8X6UJV0_NEPPI|nr:ribonuclease 3 [Nephila pilipes]
MVLPERPPPNSMPNNYTWQPPVNQSWGYAGNMYHPPLYPNAWSSVAGSSHGGPWFPSAPLMPGNGPPPPNSGPPGASLGVPPSMYPTSMSSPAGPSGLPFSGPGVPPTYPIPPPMFQPPLPVMLPSAVTGNYSLAHPEATMNANTFPSSSLSSNASQSTGKSDRTSEDARQKKNAQESSRYYKSREENISSNLQLKSNPSGDSDFKSKKGHKENISSDNFKALDRKKGQYISATQEISRKTSESSSSMNRKSYSDSKGSSRDKKYSRKSSNEKGSKESRDRSPKHSSYGKSHSYRRSRSRSSHRFVSDKKDETRARKIRSHTRRSSEEKNFEKNARCKRSLSKSPSMRNQTSLNSKAKKNNSDDSKLEDKSLNNIEESIKSGKAMKDDNLQNGSKFSKGIRHQNSSELKNSEISLQIDENQMEGTSPKHICCQNELSASDLHEVKGDLGDEVVKCKSIKTCPKVESKKKCLSRSRSRSMSPFQTERRERSHSRIRSHSRGRSPSFKFQSRNRNEQRRQGVSKYNRRRSREPDLPQRRPRSREREDTPENQPSLSTEACKWVRSTPAEMYYIKSEECSREVLGIDALKDLHKRFKYELLERAARIRAGKPKYEPPVRKTKLRNHKPKELRSDDDSLSSSEKSSSSEEEDTSLEELEKKRKHPDRLHPELWFNDPKEMNDGPLCRCSAKARRSGIRHGIYVGEDHLPSCEPYSNNATKLFHYKIAMTPVTNFLTKSPTIIMHEGEKYVFEGFSMFAHKPLPRLPNCKVIRFNYEYTILYVEEQMPINFTVAGLELLSDFLLREILELVDLDWKAHNDPDGCPQFHFMPRFAKITKEDTKEGKELLSLNVILEYLLKANSILIDEKNLSEVLAYSNKKWQDLADEVKGMIVTCPGMKPSSIRVDQLDREHIGSNSETTFPVIVHFGVRPPQLSYAGNPQYQKAWRDYVKYRHLLANKPKVRYADRHKLMQKETRLQEMRMENDLKRDVTVVISSKGFYKTGIMSDVVQHAMLLPVLVCHLRFHYSLTKLEENIGYRFIDRFLLQLALTHPSYRENFGTNPDHARNSLTNCGLRQPQYGDRRIHYMNTRKRGINTLINIMSRFGSQQEATSSINHNERLEFLGDAVVEFLSSIHLFYMFPDLEEGGLATYRAAIVQNQHLAVLSRKLQLEKFMLYAHGSDLCHDLELRHAMANCFEALMGALFLDGGIEVADKVFSATLFPEPELQEVWKNYPLHPLQEQEPDGDRKWIESVPLLQKLHKFEEQIGIEFTHIRLLARALTHRSLGYNNLTLGSNQRLEFLGDTVLQLIASEYLYKFFPQHHEGHLSLLRSSLVNNRTQAVVCGDLGMVQFAVYPYFKVELKPKDKADLLEAFLGALYVDKDLGYCRKFCEVCFFPRLQDFIMNQDWNDPKSKLQQCCLTLRSMDGGEPDIPTYKVIECKGPTNTRVYNVAVYFQGNRLAVGSGHSIQQAEMDAASNALQKSKDLFPQLRHQKRAIERSLKQGNTRKQKQCRKLETKIEI